MEMINSKKFQPFKNLSLKWSFALYVAVCIITAIFLSFLFSNIFSSMQYGIQKKYDELYRDELAKQAHLISDDGILNGDIWIYTEDISSKFSDKDFKLYNLYRELAVLVVPIISVLCVVAAGVIFYLKILKKPLLILDSASVRIAAGDLDFKVEYDGKNEFGRLAASFETMRGSLYEVNRKMWQMMEERRRLNTAFAHDLRTPLTVLKGYCDFLLKYVPENKISNEKVISTLSTMDKYLKRLEGYTITMSSLQKLDEIELSPKDVNYSSICDELKNISVMLASEKKIDFNCYGDGMLYIDLPVVFQTYENLLSNAVRYAENEIKVNCVVKDDIFSITVADDGSGFTPEVMKNATKPYYSTEKDIYGKHFGIGLYICRLMCEKHGGFLIIENDRGGKVTASFSVKKNE